MSGTLIGYARCSTDDQDLTAQRDRLRDLGVAERRIYLDHGLTGTNRRRPGLDQALAAVRGGDTLVVPKLDGSPDPCPTRARSATTSPPAASSSPSAGRSTTPPTPWAKCSSTSSPPSPNSRSTSSGSAREGMAVARANGRLRGRQPKLSTKQQAELRRMHATGDYSVADLAELFTVSRPTVYRTLQRS